MVNICWTELFLWLLSLIALPELTGDLCPAPD